MEEKEDSMTVENPQPTIESITEKIKKWYNTEVHREGGQWKFYCKTETKLVTFLLNNEFTLEDFNQIRFSNPARDEDEDYEDYKIRRKFKKSSRGL